VASVDVKVPNIGDFKDVPVIDVLVKAGDKVDVDTPLVTLESEKASMDVPSPSAGVVEAVNVKIGDKVSEGTAILKLAQGNGAAAQPAPPAPSAAIDVRVPNIGDFKDVPVIDVLVKAGDIVQSDAPLVTLESEKASRICGPSTPMSSWKRCSKAKMPPIRTPAALMQLDSVIYRKLK